MKAYHTAMAQYREFIDLFDLSLLNMVAARCRLVAGYPDDQAKRETIWQEMGHYEDGIKQGLTGETLSKVGDLLDQVCDVEHHSIPDDTKPKDLLGSMEVIDKTIIFILSERFKVVQQIGVLKKKYDQDALDPKRWEKLFNQRLEQAKLLGLNQTFTGLLFNLIHEAALTVERQVGL